MKSCIPRIAIRCTESIGICFRTATVPCARPVRVAHFLDWLPCPGLSSCRRDGPAQDIRASVYHMHLRSGYPMTTIPDTKLYAHSARLQGKVVLITGKGDWSLRALFIFSFQSLRCRRCSRYWERNRPAVREVEVGLSVRFLTVSSN